MSWTNAQHAEALEAVRLGKATDRQRLKMEEAARSGDPARGKNAEARRAIEDGKSRS